MDDRGELLLTGDESGTICARLLHSSSPGDHEGSQDMGRRSREFGVGERSRGEGGGGRGGGGIAKVVDGAHAGGIQAISHVEGSYAEGSSNSAGDGIRDSSALFVSGGKGGEMQEGREAKRETMRFSESIRRRFTLGILMTMMVAFVIYLGQEASRCLLLVLVLIVDARALNDARHLLFPVLCSVFHDSGGVVRLWRATWPGRRSESVGAAAGTELQVELVNDMLVGGFQVLLQAQHFSKP